MKKLLALTAFFFALLGFLYFSPRFLEIDTVQDTITVKANQLLGMEVSVGEVSLHWFPYPHLTIAGLLAQDDHVAFNLPKVHAIPDWKSLMHRQLVLGRLKIIKPEVTIKEFQAGGLPPAFNFVGLDFDIDISDGSLAFPQLDFVGEMTLRENKFSNMNADISIQNNRVKFDFSGNASFCGKITSRGRIDFNNFYFRINSYYENFNLHELTSSVSEKICTVDRQNNFSAHIEGVTIKNFKLRLKGDFPSLKLNDATIPDLVDNQISEVSFEKYDDDFFINFNNFRLSYPQLTLDGKIFRQKEKETGLPIWDLDITGKNLDLNEARDLVLTLWPDNEIGKKVCSIVQGGKTGITRYVFNGPAEDFRHIRRMQLWVDVENAKIYIPDIDLRLDNATGPISILDGILTGTNLTANISSSSGSKGSFLLDLQENGRAFQLDLDLDTDIAGLKDVLENIVNEPGFLRELHHFHDLEGRAKGHLSLGDRLDELSTIVDVNHIKAKGSYDRIPWPFTIQSGSLKITPGKTEWRSIEGSIGPHTIQKSSAKVSWEEHAIISMHEFEAQLDADSLLEEGRFLIGEETYAATEFLSPLLSELRGLINISGGQLSGPATLPKSWNYKADLAAENTYLLSSHLPGPVFIEHAEGNISNERMHLKTKAKIFDDSFFLLADYTHNNLAYWQGSAVFSGTINQQLIDWLDSKNTIPTALKFRTPLYAENVRLTTEGSTLEQFKLSGRIVADQSDSDNSALEFDINRLKSQFQNSVSLKHKKEAGKIVYNIWDSTPKKTLLTWNGELSSKAIDRFFNIHPIISGKIKGVFSLLSSPDEKNSSYSGHIEASNLKWKSKKGETPFVLDSLLLGGNEDNIQISKAEISYPNGDKASLKGSVETDTKSLKVDIDLTSQDFSSESLATTLSYFKKGDSAAEDSLQKQLDTANQERDQKIKGNLGFSIENFIYSAKKTPVSPENLSADKSTDNATDVEAPRSYPWTNIVGEAHIADRDIQVDFSSAQLCGIKVHGKWKSAGESSTGTYFINDTGPLKFQETLPCLGINQSIIEGDFRIETELSGTPENWETGKLKILSPGGVIRRMELLSKIFSVVNFTEFLTFKDLPDMNTEGLMYNDLVMESHIDNHKLHIDKAFLKGKGLNLTGQGSMNFSDLSTNFTIFVAPFKMLDTVVTSIPLVGRIIGGKKGAIVTFPVKVEGPFQNPSVTPLAPSAIGKATLDFITDTLSLPFAIFTPFLDNEKEKKTESAP